MTKVVEMLESKSESLPIPPIPYLFSAANSPFNQSTLDKKMKPGTVEDLEMIEDGNWNAVITNGVVGDDFSFDNALKYASLQEKLWINYTQYEP